jgi:hypothetical protein
MDTSEKKILFRYWDKIGKIKADDTILKMFHINPHKDKEKLKSYIEEWCEINKINRIQPLIDDFKKLHETSKGVYKSSYEGVWFHIKIEKFDFNFEVYHITLDVDNDWLEIEGGVDFDGLRVNNEDVFNIPSDEMDDDEYFEHFENIRNDVFEYTSEFFHNRYANTMGVDVELIM